MSSLQVVIKWLRLAVLLDMEQETDLEMEDPSRSRILGESQLDSDESQRNANSADSFQETPST